MVFEWFPAFWFAGLVVVFVINTAYLIRWARGAEDAGSRRRRYLLCAAALPANAVFCYLLAKFAAAI